MLCMFCSLFVACNIASTSTEAKEPVLLEIAASINMVGAMYTCLLVYCGVITIQSIYSDGTIHSFAYCVMKHHIMVQSIQMVPRPLCSPG